MINELNLSVVFHDITPIPQDDGPQPVCGIDYSQPFIEAMGYFRAVLRADEHSERTLDLTSVCLEHNPANYTTWHFRRQILATLSLESTATININTNTYNIDRVKVDLDFASKLGGKNPKNYQIWYHRQSLLEGLVKNDEEGLRCADDELKYTDGVFKEDAKNYHAWSHRQWVVLTANNPTIWDLELKYTDELITQDVRNNSPWNHRWFASHRAKKVPPLNVEKAILEAEYAIRIAEIDPFNESPWRYLIGVLKEQWRKQEGVASTFAVLLNEYEGKILQIKSDMKEREGVDGDSCVNLISALIDILEMKQDSSAIENAADFARCLGTKHDPIRKKYWSLREKELRLRAEV